MEKVFSMNAGDGDSSYAQNSTFLQKNVLLSAKPFLEESISSWKNTFDCETLRIADLGCSSGPNGLFVTEVITAAIRNKYALNGISVPEFQVFYNDLPSTDFNSLFRILSAAPPLEGSYFIAGVPGSFHNRLFPPNSLHFVHSSYALHWLSQVPQQVEDKNCECWNRGRIFISEQGPSGVADAYFAQFQKDFNAFLRAREKEMVVGGRMFLVVNGRLTADRKKQGSPGFYCEMLGCAIQDLVSQGLIEEEKLDSFNIPYYGPSPEELKNEVQKQGSFTIVGLKVIIGRYNVENIDDNKKELNAKFFSKQMRAVLESLISYHFGGGVVDAIFNKCAEILTNKMVESLENLNKSTKLVLVLE
ncbi:hypothetical protein KI387_019499, partial [Taxus chinensis]